MAQYRGVRGGRDAVTTPLLEGYRRCRGSDPDRMEAYLDTVGFRVEALHDDDAPLDMRVKGV